MIAFVGVLSLGIVIGWNAQTFNAFLTKKASPVKTHEVANQSETVILEKPAVEIVSPGFFSGNTLLNNTQLGTVIELIKQDLDVEKRTQLNNDVLEYARSLYSSGDNTENIEQRLLALLGNYDTKEQVLEILASFYSKKKQFKRAITSLYTLRSMTQFDEDYQEISDRIDRLSQKHLKHLNAYNYKAEMADFYEFLIAKEPDNFSVQMQYAEFEYKNRNYTHVEQLLSVLLHHPDYSIKSERLMRKAQHQTDMLTNGIVPVPVEKTGDHYIVNAVINNQEPVKLIIDTGATLTILSPRVIHNLGLHVEDVQQYMDFSTANGVVQAPVISLESMRVQNHLVSDLQVGILPTFSHSQFDGLLGMNFLNQFAFFIDQKNSMLELVEIE